MHDLAALCGIGAGTGGTAPALLLAMFLAGLAGGAVHCAPMCGGFVLGQVADGLARAPAAKICEMTRFRGALLLPYHVGRLLTYATLGAAGGAFGEIASTWRFLPSLLLMTAGTVFARNGIRRLAPNAYARGARIFSVFDLGIGSFRADPGLGFGWNSFGTIARWAGRIDRARWSGGLLMGLLLGFLPCGMLYAALIAAAATGSAWLGAAGMAAFGLGTAPALMAVGFAGHFAHRQRWSGLSGRLGGAVILANAGLLWFLAVAGS